MTKRKTYWCTCSTSVFIILVPCKRTARHFCKIWEPKTNETYGNLFRGDNGVTATMWVDSRVEIIEKIEKTEKVKGKLE